MAALIGLLRVCNKLTAFGILMRGEKEICSSGWLVREGGGGGGGHRSMAIQLKGGGGGRYGAIDRWGEVGRRCRVIVNAHRELLLLLQQLISH